MTHVLPLFARSVVAPSALELTYMYVEQLLMMSVVAIVDIVGRAWIFCIAIKPFILNAHIFTSTIVAIAVFTPVTNSCCITPITNSCCHYQ